MTMLSVRHLALCGFAVSFTVGVGAMILAQHNGTGPVTVTRLSQRAIIETIAGKAATATVEVVTIAPGQTDSAHRHTGPVFGYVLEGVYAHAIDDAPTTTFAAGETFYEPSGSVHRVARNPSDTTTTRLLAVILHARDAKEVTVREKDE